ncbi:MAG: site-2 protease family protein, partial [bacterium]
MFKSSITIGKIFGIPIKIHISFLLIIPFLAWVFGNNIQQIAEYTQISYQELSLNPYFTGLILGLFLFLSVLLHELSHSLVARSKGINIKDITLMLFGGVANMDELAEDPADEAKIAFSGPLMSLVLGFLLMFIFSFLPERFSEDLRLIFLYTGQLNIFLAIFNLLPAFPSDGGRILRAIIATKTSFLKATKIASTVGKAFAFLFGIFGILTLNILLVIIAFFLYMGASQEYQYSHIKNTLSDLKVSDLMSNDVDTVTKDTPISELLDKMMKKRHSGYPVIKGGEVVGMVTMEDIQKVRSEEHHSRT